MNRKHSLILSSGVFLIGLAFAWGGYTPRTSTAPQLQPFVQTQADTEICPLSEKQQEDSIQKFTEMMPVFTHPRCINCHGAMNPFAPNTPHLGGRIGTKFTEITRHDDILGKDLTIVVIDEDKIFSRCRDCHSAFQGSGGWIMPRPVLWFVGKDSIQLCKHMKREFGARLIEFVEHLDHDELGFIQEAFHGTRGLDDNGQATYLNETGRDLLPVPENEKPSISHEAFVAQGKAWLEAMGYPGEGRKGGLTCGCQPHHYVLKGGADIIYTAGGNPGWENDHWFSGHADLKIPITFNDDGTFNGETQVDTTFHGKLQTAPMSCLITVDRMGDTWKVSGQIDNSGQLTVTLSYIPSPANFHQVCTSGSLTTVHDDLPAPIGEWNADFSDFVSVGDTLQIEINIQGSTLKAPLMIIEEGQ